MKPCFSKTKIRGLIEIISAAAEYEDLSIRHGEDGLLRNLATRLPNKLQSAKFNDPHVKANLLLQAHMTRAQLPCSDYLTDTKSVMDNAMRVLQENIDIYYIM